MWRCRGFTLIEVMVYVPLVSLLLSGLISIAYTIHWEDIHLIQEIDDAYASNP